MTNNNRTLIIVVSLSASIFSIVILLLSSSSYLLLFWQQPNDKPFYAFAQKQQEVGNVNTSSPDLSLLNLINQGSPYLGSKLAPVIVIDFSDLQCHLCARYVKNTEPKINETYIQTGKVALVFKHLPNRGFDSMPAALAAQCTNDQGKFWQFHNMLYENQGPIDSGWANKDNLKKFASQIPGLDMQKFNSCFDGQKYKSLIGNDISLAHSLGFKETPSFIIVKSDGSNPQKIEGPQPFPAFRAVIDKEV
jgi:protein-disulfide isomerase